VKVFRFMQRHSRPIGTVGIVAMLLLCAFMLSAVRAESAVISVCPNSGIQDRGQTYPPGGIILAAFDGGSMWVYNIDTNRRYPLPDTNPCGTNCRLSRDSRWVTYVDSQTNAYAKMRLDGTERTQLVDYAADIEWWSQDTLLVWTPGKSAYLRPEAEDTRAYLDVHDVMAVQPGGHWGLMVEQRGDNFTRALINLDARDVQGITDGYYDLGLEKPYFDAARWSPDGQWLAFTGMGSFNPQAGLAGGELYAIQPASGRDIVQWTDLTAVYGAARINGRTSTELSWSPDSSKIAFWVIELTGLNPEANTGIAVIHVLTAATGEVRSYCGFATNEHTPNPPRLIWSPDSHHIAFGGNVPGDDKGYLLLALDVESGVFTQLSDGIYPTLGGANPIAWGYPP
jgi:Tol biopolymer transport system component